MAFDIENPSITSVIIHFNIYPVKMQRSYEKRDRRILRICVGRRRPRRPINGCMIAFRQGGGLPLPSRFSAWGTRRNRKRLCRLHLRKKDNLRKRAERIFRMKTMGSEAGFPTKTEQKKNRSVEKYLKIALALEKEK